MHWSLWNVEQKVEWLYLGGWDEQAPAGGQAVVLSFGRAKALMRLQRNCIVISCHVPWSFRIALVSPSGIR
jgi:hypothetical protein